MKNTKILRAIGGVDDELIERASQKNTVRRVTFAPWLKWAMPLAACFVIAAAIALPMMLNNPAINPDSQTLGGGVSDVHGNSINDDTDTEAPNNMNATQHSLSSLGNIFGLPTSGYTWDEGESGFAASRVAVTELRHLMYAFDRYYVHNEDLMTAFAIIRVINTERFTEGNLNTLPWREGQIAACDILYAYSDFSIENKVNVKQYLYGGCINDEETNLIRIGGVYVLPLVNQQNEDYWTVYGDLDCLFEVDDKGLIESHSRNEQLNKYDGRALAELWEDIGYLFENPILRTSLANRVSEGYEIVVRGNKIALYKKWLDGTEWYGWEAEDADGFSADIGADGRITIATDGFNVFRPVEGMTIDEIENQVLQIKQFLGLAEVNPPELFEPGISEPPATPIDGTDYSSYFAVESPERAKDLLVEEYARQGFGEVFADFQAVTTLWEKTDVYLFIVTFADVGTDATEYAAIIVSNGNFMRLEALPDGDFSVNTGLALP